MLAALIISRRWSRMRVETAVGATALAFNIAFLITFPVTFDRSITLSSSRG